MNMKNTTDSPERFTASDLLGVRGSIGDRRVLVTDVEGMDIGSQILPAGWIRVNRECRHPKSFRMTRIFQREYFSPNPAPTNP